MTPCTFDLETLVKGYLVAGQWGVHRSQRKHTLWVVRHLGTGLAVGTEGSLTGWNTRKQAAAMAEYLDRVLPETREEECEEFLTCGDNRTKILNAIAIGRTMARCAALR